MALVVTAESFEPDTANDELAVEASLFAFTVITRFDGSAPIDTTAVAWPDDDVSGPDAVK
jgi:hypothetical protein